MSGGFRIAIPARYGSTRLPGKPLTPLAGRPMIEHVWRRACEAGAVEVIVATDDDRIAAAARGFGAEVCMTHPGHASGTDRLAEVAASRGWGEDDIVVNLQGDEPLMPPALLGQVAADLAARPTVPMATLATPLDRELIDDPNIVKVVTDAEGSALYFSRAPIPFWREGAPPHATPAGLRHLGIYAYRVGFLKRLSALEPSPLERAEQLEQLRALWHGHAIHVSETETLPAPGVDGPADVERVAAVLATAGD